MDINEFNRKNNCKKYSYRVEELEEMKNALNIFKNKIKFTYSPIGEIFEEISQNTSIKNIANIFTQAKNNMNNQTASEAWDKSLEEINTNMKRRRYKKLKTYQNYYGSSDAEGQISQIELTEEFFRNQIQEAIQERKKE